MALILQNGSSYPIIDATSFITVADATAWLSQHAYIVDSADIEPLLIRAYDFIQILDVLPKYYRIKNTYILKKKFDKLGVEIPPIVFAIPPQFAQAQCYLINCLSKQGGDVDLNKGADAKQLTEKNLGRTAIAKKWSFDKTLARTDPVSMLKRCPMAYNLLKPFLASVYLDEFNIQRT